MVLKRNNKFILDKFLLNLISISTIGILWLQFFLIQPSNGIMLLPIEPSDFGNENGEGGDFDGLFENIHFGQKRWSPIQNRATAGARLDRLIDALFSPTFQRRRTRGIHQLGVAHHPRQIGQWRPAFHRTGGTILLGKRRGGRAINDELWTRKGNQQFVHQDENQTPIGKRRAEEREIMVDPAFGVGEEEWPEDEEMLAVRPKAIPGLVYG